MTKLLQMTVETLGSTKVVYHAHYSNKEIATCKVTWFPLQETAHVWFLAPAVNNRHCVTLFQKMRGSFQEVVHEFMVTFQQIMWLLVPVLQGSGSIDMLPYRLVGLSPTVVTLVRALIKLKKSVDFQKKHGFKHPAKCGVDDGASNSDAAQRGAATHV